ncbi:MAG: aspartate aminotransferase family protein [Jatrophihabitantaceae bacterium]
MTIIDVPVTADIPSEQSAATYARALRVMPGGNTRTAVFTSPYPLYAQSGRGARVTDIDGVERIDFLNNSTSLIHGHAHPWIVRAVTEAIGRGSCFGLPTVLEVELAEAICARNDTFEQIRFTSTGTEAVMMAVQAARAFTGRPMLAKLAGAYHGAYDAVTIDNEGVGSAGTPVGLPDGVRHDTVTIPFNDPDGSLAVLRRHAAELACVLIDPVPWRLGLLPATSEYLRVLREFCDSSGALLISDEVGSFRVGYHGAIHALGGSAHLTVLGKVIGGGMPIGAVAGLRDPMSVFDPSQGHPPLPHSGSYNGNPVSMSAGLASMSLLTADEISRINQLGEQARQLLRRAIDAQGLGWTVNGMGSLFRIVGPRPTAGPPPVAVLYRALLGNGILLGESGLGCISTPMAAAEVDQLATATERSLAEMAGRIGHDAAPAGARP